MESTSKTQRVKVAGPAGARSSLDVQAVVTNTAKAGTSNAVFALAEAMRGAHSLSVKADKDTVRKGAADFQSGNVDENNTSRLYRNSVNRLQARADWIKDSRSVTNSLKDLDLDNISQQDLDSHIDEQFRGLYGGLEDETIANELLPKMQAFREKAYADVLERQEIVENETIESNLTTAAEDAYTASREDGVEFDYHGLNDQINAVRRGSDRNEAYFKVISDMAIRNGDVDLLRNLPDKWESGQATFKDIPAWNQRMRSAEAEALRVGAAREVDAEKAEAKAQEDAINGVMINAITMSETDYAGSQALLTKAANEMPGFEFKTFNTMRTALQANHNATDKIPTNESAVSALTIRVFEGAAGFREVAEAMENGIFGKGEHATDRMREMLQVVRSVDAKDSKTNRQAAIYIKDLTLKYKPDNMTDDFDGTLADTQRNAIRELKERIYENGEDPRQAWIAVRDEHDKSAALSTVTGALNNAWTPTQSVGRVIRGDMSPTDAKKAGVTRELVDELKAANLLTAKQAFDLRSKL